MRSCKPEINTSNTTRCVDLFSTGFTAIDGNSQNYAGEDEDEEMADADDDEDEDDAELDE